MSNAILSPCGIFRFRLEREVGAVGETFAYFGINPSTADASIDDQTVKKWIGFTKVFSGRRFIIGNAFPFRATDVRALRQVRDHRLAENDRHLLSIAADADILVPCWGSRNKIPAVLRPRLDDVLSLLCSTGKPMMCFGKTNDGDPLHPLTLAYSTALQEL